MSSRPALHPQNQSFEWRTSPVTGRLPSAMRRQFDENGYALYEQAFDPDQVRRMIEEIDPIEQRTEDYLRRQEGGRVFISRAGEITFSAHLVARNDYLREMSRAPAILDLCHDLIGPDVRLYWDQAVYKKPGNPQEFPFHQDNGYTFIDPQQYLTCWVALTDTDEGNGCPWVVPGWHRYGTLEHESTDLGWRCVERSPDAVAVPARAGDIVVFSSLTPHRTGPNMSGDTRKAYILQYAPDGVRRLDDSELAGYQDDPERQYLVLSGGEPVDG